ncbi:MAG: class I SAM-dependent methyltransferase [Acidobacteriota bacterium]
MGDRAPAQDSFFIAWSGPAGCRIALALKSYLEGLFSPLEFFVSEADIRSGSLWLQEIGRRLSAVNSGIAVITPDALASPWLHFESGALAKELLASRDSRSRLYTYLVDVEPAELSDSPLSDLQARKAKSDTLRLVEDILGNLTIEHPPRPEHLLKIARGSWPEFQAQLEDVSATFESSFEISRVAARLSRLAMRAAHQDNLSNPYLQTVLKRSLDGEQRRLAELCEEQRLPIPHTLYPEYLVELMKEHPGAQVKAIALLDGEESFWSQSTEARLLEASPKHCVRIFGFRDRDHMRKHLPMVRRHATRYHVRGVPYNRLVNTTYSQQDPYDFSIVGELVSGQAILARYSSGDVSKRSISFSMDGSKLSEHHDLFSSIHAIAIDVRAFKDSPDDALIEAVFEEKEAQSPLRTAPVEMSAYIEIDEYRKHEWRHAYYLDMHDTMLEIFEEFRRDRPRPISVLELGAGTGTFTQKLIERGDLDLTAIEIDWLCYGALVETVKAIDGTSGEASPGGGPRSARHMQDFLTAKHSFTNRRLGAEVLCHNEDARDFDPGGSEGRYHVIFSSFADHHIVSVDKRRYFDNIRDNLEPGGLVIVGDEYLPPHADADREQALRTYHQHIIDVTHANHGQDAEGLIRLETAALESGLNELGDFKLSCAQYERYVVEAGFRFEKRLIGPASPAEAERVGGIYVYLLRADG